MKVGQLLDGCGKRGCACVRCFIAERWRTHMLAVKRNLFLARMDSFK